MKKGRRHKRTTLTADLILRSDRESPEPFTGRVLIGNGAPGTVAISSPAQLGAVPATFTFDQVTLNRGTLTTTATMTLNDANRGILLERGGGTFNVASGTTLTLGGTVSTPTITSSFAGGALIKTGGGTLILISLVMFLIVGSFFGALGLGPLGDYWPALLVALGLLILVQGLLRRR